jgi:tRNA pseudouridine38-40 synthase
VKDVRRTLLVEFGYRGRNFHGVQPQPGLRTAGGELRKLVEAKLETPVSGVSFSARTDAGVDAKQNFATMCFRASSDWGAAPLSDWAPGSDQLWIRSISLVPRSLHARNSATGKHYRYQIRAETPPEHPSALSNHQIWTVVPALNVEAMRAGARRLLGKHDFSSFRAGGCAAKDPVKQLTRCDVLIRDGLVVCELEGNAFLRKMVRIIVGTLAEVGAGLRKPDDVSSVLSACARKRAGLTAPARGLTLMSVTLAGVTTSDRTGALCHQAE